MSTLAVIESVESKLKAAIMASMITSNESFEYGFVKILEVAAAFDRESVGGHDVLGSGVAVAHHINAIVGFEGRETDPSVRNESVFTRP